MYVAAFQIYCINSGLAASICFCWQPTDKWSMSGTHHKSVDLDLGTIGDRQGCLLGLVLKHGTEVPGGVNGGHALILVLIPLDVLVVFIVALHLRLPLLKFGTQGSCLFGTLWGFNLCSSKEAQQNSSTSTMCVCIKGSAADIMQILPYIIACCNLCWHHQWYCQP